MNGTESKMSETKINHLRKKSNWQKVCGENARGKGTEMLEFMNKLRRRMDKKKSNKTQINRK